MHTVDALAHDASLSGTPADLMARAEQFAYQYGQTYDSYLVAQNDREHFWSRDRRGVVGFVRWGRYVQVVGGLLAPDEHRETLLAEFLQFVRRSRLHATFFNLSRDQIELFRTQGCQITKCGEEPVVRLDKTTWKGKDYQWVRRQENYCLRQGLELKEVAPDPQDPEYRERIVPELEAISRAHLATTLHGKELQFFVGRCEPLALGRRRLFLAIRQSRIEAFIVCNPCLDGAMWAIETYRRRPDATRSVIPFAMLQTMRRLQADGIHYASLSLVPCLRCGLRQPGDSPIFWFLATLWWKRLNWIFDLRGIYHYKSRFRPHYREMYMATMPKITCASMVALVATWKLFSFNPLRLLTRSLRKRRKTWRRETLATPKWRAGRLLRNIRSPNTERVPANSPSPFEAADPVAPAGADESRSSIS